MAPFVLQLGLGTLIVNEMMAILNFIMQKMLRQLNFFSYPNIYYRVF